VVFNSVLVVAVEVRVLKEVLAQQGHRERKEPKEVKEQLEQLALKVLKGLLVYKEVRELKEAKVLLRGQQVLLEHKGRKELKVAKEV
jgi:hypothetical protein